MADGFSYFYYCNLFNLAIAEEDRCVLRDPVVMKENAKTKSFAATYTCVCIVHNDVCCAIFFAILPQRKKMDTPRLAILQLLDLMLLALLLVSVLPWMNLCFDLK
jgi:hypothetical protein